MMVERIEKSIDLKAPIDRVWRALADPAEFGDWFRVKLDGPFIPGEITRGRMTYPGFEHHPWVSKTVAMEEPHYLAFSWPPYYGETDLDTSGDAWPLVEFRLEPTDGGTRLTLIESGFDALPEDRRFIALRNNEGGWEEQMRNIAAHVGG